MAGGGVLAACLGGAGGGRTPHVSPLPSKKEGGAVGGMSAFVRRVIPGGDPGISMLKCCGSGVDAGAGEEAGDDRGAGAGSGARRILDPGSKSGMTALGCGVRGVLAACLGGL